MYVGKDSSNDPILASDNNARLPKFKMSAFIRDELRLSNGPQDWVVVHLSTAQGDKTFSSVRHSFNYYARVGRGQA